jgi:hypothetical protein
MENSEKYWNNRSLRGVLSALLGLGAVVLTAREADACGGFFCSQTQPVNQAAERIIFAQNGNGTVTAVIQILYQGPSQNFSWLLPISTPPAPGDLQLASNLAFVRLQQATNPRYTLTTRVEGQCRTDRNIPAPTAAAGPPFFAGGSSAGAAEQDSVTVVGQGVVGAFEWTALAFDPALPEPADAAVTWLTENGYDVTPGSEDLLGPYLQSGQYLLALKLTKGADAGSIRPIVLTYAGDLPAIPIKLTAVAANDDMGVMAWVSAPSRAIPFNYNALELNEARINWFTGASNYSDVVTAAADEAGGQGFVTEFAGGSGALANVVWSTDDESSWQRLRATQFQSFQDLFGTTYDGYQAYDGFWDAVRTTVTLPEGVTFEDFQLCPNCYTGVSLQPAAYMRALEDNVIAPMRRVQQLIDGQPYLTRLYSTLSAREMTVDPVFNLNASLRDVSNVHTAERIIECNSSVTASEANWRIELPQGGVVRGTARDVGTWPAAAAEQPPNFRVLKLATEGAGVVVQDNSTAIASALESYNAGVPGRGSASGAGGIGSPNPQGNDVRTVEQKGCGFVPGHDASWAWALCLGAGVAVTVRRRRLS